MKFFNKDERRRKQFEKSFAFIMGQIVHHNKKIEYCTGIIENSTKELEKWQDLLDVMKEIKRQEDENKQ